MYNVELKCPACGAPVFIGMGAAKAVCRSCGEVVGPDGKPAAK